MSITMRDAFGQALTELHNDPRIIVLDADLGKATRAINFKKVCPERFLDMGIAEQDMIGTAAGLAICGKIPFATTFAVFATGRAFEQIRNSVAYPKLNVKIAATHAGITVGYDGGSHQSVVDIALMRSLPNMVILQPADAIETKQAIYASIEYYGPVYIRLSRIATPVIHDPNYKFKIGKAEVLRKGKDVAIIATGIMVSKALEAADKLQAEGIKATVVNVPTIKPLDREVIIKVAQETGKVVTAEEHSVIGGLGSAVCEVLAEEMPTKTKMLGIQDRFGCSGSPDELLKHFKLTVEDIVNAAKY
ncbi:Hypothetical protein LUCI_5010 [Lucifera butyrica]|uniref:Transketolase-like pyrimidine-binding domain-containing protein n=1 Tax=Lucifera butyrica TaxID=1351585 RepID=A0A498RHZ2_9FIRM|nr:transketolase family protein [Lucifera butyrica]VBB09712.1 Hypothetical protein LUCI_5010 [Lucifera butyrica]